jgi:hypothetical protein
MFVAADMLLHRTGFVHASRSQNRNGFQAGGLLRGNAPCLTHGNSPACRKDRFLTVAAPVQKHDVFEGGAGGFGRVVIHVNV